MTSTRMPPIGQSTPRGVGSPPPAWNDASSFPLSLVHKNSLQGGSGSILCTRQAADMSGWFTLFTNCRYVLNGELVEDHLVISDETGLILKRDGYIGGEAIDLEDTIIAPGFLELHTNGANGFHFTHFEDEISYGKKIDGIARYYATQGVTGFWATLPTIKVDEFQKVCTRMAGLYHWGNTTTDVLADSSSTLSSRHPLVSLAPGRAYRRPIPSSFKEGGA